MKNTGVTKRTWDKNARKFAMASTSAWRNFNAFVSEHCKRKSKKERDAFSDALSEVVDEYVKVNCEILTWCHKNGVNPQDFVCDVNNLGFGNL